MDWGLSPRSLEAAGWAGSPMKPGLPGQEDKKGSWSQKGTPPPAWTVPAAQRPPPTPSAPSDSPPPAAQRLPRGRPPAPRRPAPRGAPRPAAWPSLRRRPAGPQVQSRAMPAAAAAPGSWRGRRRSGRRPPGHHLFIAGVGLLGCRPALERVKGPPLRGPDSRLPSPTPTWAHAGSGP